MRSGRIVRIRRMFHDPGMDLHNVEELIRPLTRADLPEWRDTDVLLAGGTALFSEPQPGVRRLIDLSALGWPSLEISPGGLRIAATCTLADAAAARLPAEWTAASLIAGCCRALAGSHKIWNAATVGGNLCHALPAAPMLAMGVALDGVAVIWRTDGGERRTPMLDFAVGPQRTVLGRGEVLRAIDIPAAALRRRAALRQASLTDLGRSAALVAATLDPADGEYRLTVTASVPQPLQIAWRVAPSAAAIDTALAALPANIWYDDVHGSPAWRRHMTQRLAGELLHELTA